ncbi:hypothetical protein MKX03_005674 [Papaver bracteatum]|nr:hypothetical protein MKX03_005674 [Papaver bracteatum]
METEVYETVFSDEHGSGMELVGGMEHCREKCLFVIEKYFIQPSETVVVLGKYKTGYSNLDRKNMFFVCGDVVVPAERLSTRLNYSLLIPDWLVFMRVIKLHIPPKTNKSRIELELEQRLPALLLTNEKDCEILSRKLDETEGQSEIILRKYLKDWLFEDYRKTMILDSKGQGVLHILASLDYTWAISLYRFAGLKLDGRDRSGWTPLHWAAFYGRKGAVTVLLHEGANPSILTKPTDEYPNGLNAADIAANRGHNELADYLTKILENPKMIVSISAHLAETGTHKCMEMIC